MLYWNQLKNKMFPYSSCFNSSVAMLLSEFGIQKTPDQVYHDLHTPEMTALGKKLYPKVWDRWKNKRRMLWELEEAYINKVLDEYGVSARAVFNHGQPVNVSSKADSRPVIVGTRPKYKGRRLGHIMVVTSSPDYNGTRRFFLNDPFGNPVGEYREGSDGHLVLVTGAFFKSIYAGNCIYIQEG